MPSHQLQQQCLAQVIGGFGSEGRGLIEDARCHEDGNSSWSTLITAVALSLSGRASRDLNQRIQKRLLAGEARIPTRAQDSTTDGWIEMST